MNEDIGKVTELVFKCRKLGAATRNILMANIKKDIVDEQDACRFYYNTVMYLLMDLLCDITPESRDQVVSDTKRHIDFGVAAYNSMVSAKLGESALPTL